MFRRAELTVVANVPELGEQVVGLRVGRCAARSQARWVSVLDVVEYLGDEFRLCDVCDDAKLATAQRTQCDVDTKRFSRCAQVRGAMGGCVGLSGWFAGGVTEPLGVGRLRLLVCVGTIKRRRGALGAKTPPRGW